MAHVVSVEAAGFGVTPVIALSGREAMNELAPFHVEVLLPEPVAEADILRKGATMRFEDEEDGSTRHLELVIAHVDAQGPQRRGHRYLLTLLPPGWLFSQRSAHRVWVDKTTREILDELAKNAKVKLRWRLTGTYMKRLQCAQIAETEWAFVERLLSEEGIAYFWDVDDDGPVLVLVDDPGAHDGIEGGPIQYQGVAGLVGQPTFDEIESTHEMTSKGTHVRDYDVRQPAVLIEGKAGEATLEVFEFPANVLNAAAAKFRAKVRLEQLQRDAHKLTGRGDIMRARPGFWLQIEGCMDDEGNGKFLVVSVEHDYRQPTPEGERPRAYESHVVMVPIDARTYRPAPPSGKQRTSEIEAAVTTGPSGEEIHVDDLGRLKIRMLWDRSGIGDDKSSTWVRCLQIGMGGSMLLPRVGWEVPVAFAYGNPDIPVVLGRTYNAKAVVPYGLPAAAMKTTLQSATSPGGGGTNEVRMDDSGGKQEVFVHASKDQTVKVGGNLKTQVGNNETYDIGLSHGLGVKGTHTHMVGASQKVAVGTEHQLTVKGARNETIGGMEKVDVTGNVTVMSKSSYTEVVGAMHGLECNQSNTAVKGAFSLAVGGSMSVAGALGVSENVMAIRSETIGGARVIAAGKYTEEVKGAKTITAGASSDKAANDLVTKATGDATVNAASLKVTASGPLIYQASEISFEISGSLTAGALKLAGSTLKATKGTTKVKGTIKRQGETKIE